MLLILALGLISSYYLYRSNAAAANIIKDNYETIVYSNEMLACLDQFQLEIQDNPPDTVLAETFSGEFEQLLTKQANNVTESGERQLTERLQGSFARLQGSLNRAAGTREGRINGQIAAVRGTLHQIIDMNMHAMLRKNDQARETARSAAIYVGMIGAISFLIAFVFIVNFPGYIARPIREMDLARTNFMAAVSHELKTPIASIKMGAQLLDDGRIGALNKEQKHLVATIKGETGRLLKITGELLNVAQLETGNIQLDIQSVRPREIIDYARQAVEFQAGQRNISLVSKIEEDLPAIRADMEKTSWVLVNLISNAIRYSEPGSTVVLTVYRKEERVNFSVEDKGPGIKKQHQARVFEKFYRAPGSGKGTGLGLAISKDFIEAQGGTIGLESVPGQGSTFYFSLHI